MSTADVRRLHRRKLIAENAATAPRGADGAVSGPRRAVPDCALAAPLDATNTNDGAGSLPPALSGADGEGAAVGPSPTQET